VTLYRYTVTAEFVGTCDVDDDVPEDEIESYVITWALDDTPTVVDVDYTKEQA